jgi:starch-binding outer membrane protein SusE/F
MKTILRNSIFALAALAFGSCSVEDNNTVALAETPAKLLTPTTGTTLVLNPADATKIATTLVWDFSKNGVDSPANYTVQIAKGGTNFKDPIDASAATAGKFLSLTVEQLNSKLDPINFIPYTQANVDVRVKSSLGTGVNAMLQYSNVITLKVTPYSLALPKIAVPGNHQGWSPSTAPLLASSDFGKTNYEGYVTLNGEYKFATPNPTTGIINWSNQGGGPEYSDDGSFSSVLVQGGSTNCTATAGLYLLKANTGAIVAGTNPNGLTYSATPITRWGITGDATPIGWPDSPGANNQDQAMTNVPNTKKWTITLALTGGKQVKFRANNAWSINLGKFTVGKINDEYGGENMSYNGDNIIIATSGTYIITLDLSNPRDYKYSIVLQ